ncbi:MAG: methyltransferase domain-containing protein [Hamadaea sp.]|nr:methyltransferase domain-containing protein [Hamadaea sp.]NUT23292.1 methyltransferase domain-containing protein [Hamadaea sp.]
MEGVVQQESQEVRPDLARVFDSIGAHYGEAFSDKPGQHETGEWLLERLGETPRRPPVVLDVGCGTGLPTARQLVAGGCEVVGVDASPVMLDIARHEVPEAIFVERDLHDLAGLHPYEDKFDAAVAFFSLLVLPRTEIEDVLEDIRRELKHGAFFALGMVEGDTDYLLREFLGEKVPLTAYPRGELRDLLTRHGFAVVELLAQDWAPPPGSPAPHQTHLYARCQLMGHNLPDWG